MTTINMSTRLVAKAADGAIRHPLYMSDVRRENPQWSFPAESDVEFIRTLGYEVIHPTPMPAAEAGHTVTEGTPELDGEGLWKQTWVMTPHTVEEVASALKTVRSEKNTEVGRLLANALEKGFPFKFDDGTTGHVQIRDGDRANHVGMRARADDFIVLSQDTAIMPFRDWENVTHECLPEEIVRLSTASYDSYLLFLAAAWRLKDAISKAMTVEEMPELPEEITLPVVAQE